MNKSKVYYIIYNRLKKKYPNWLDEDIRNTARYLVGKRFNNQKGGVEK